MTSIGDDSRSVAPAVLAPAGDAPDDGRPRLSPLDRLLTDGSALDRLVADAGPLGKFLSDAEYALPAGTAALTVRSADTVVGAIARDAFPADDLNASNTQLRPWADLHGRPADAAADDRAHAQRLGLEGGAVRRQAVERLAIPFFAMAAESAVALHSHGRMPAEIGSAG